MQNLSEGDSVVLDTNSFDTNGKVGKIVSINDVMNRCIVEVEGVHHHLSLQQVYKRSFLAEG